MATGHESRAAVVGLEIHARLPTRTKLFCGCANRYGDPPNANTCPTCLGLPGALPTLNAAAVALAVRVAAALGCKVHSRSTFARKNYFYPDLPKGYQITQYDEPLATGGRLAVRTGDLEREIPIARIHIEEDAGKSVSDRDAGVTLVDYNRAGTPLVEIVTGPQIGSAAEAVECVKALRSLLMDLGACDGRMEEGSLRVDVNVSIPPGERVEIKNMNSTSFLAAALSHEVERQARIAAAGGTVARETRRWDEGTRRTEPLRPKEEDEDYRYFPEPDLPPLVIEEGEIARMAAVRPDASPAVVRRSRARVLDEGPAPSSDPEEIERACRRAVEEHPEEARAFADGSGKLIEFFMGRVMKRSAHRLPHGAVRATLERLLGGGEKTS